MRIPNIISEDLIPESPQQIRVYNHLLKLIGPGPAQFFVDACRLMRVVPSFQSTTHLVSHLLREIFGATLAVLEQNTTNNGFQENKNENSRIKIFSVLDFLQATSDDQLSKSLLRIAGLENNYKGLNSWAHRNNLEFSRPVDNIFLQSWNESVDVLDKLLSLFENKYGSIYDKLDKLKNIPNPQKADITYLKTHIPNNFVTLNYFLDGLDNPVWFNLLIHENFFAYPPQKIIDSKSGSVSFPPWAQSRYLVQQASKNSELVSKAILSIYTDNEAILADLIEAIIKLPTSIGKLHVTQIITWPISIPYLHGKNIIKLIENFAENNLPSDVMLLLGRFLPLRKSSLQNTTLYYDNFENIQPSLPFSKWEYKELLETIVLKISYYEPFKIFDLLLNILNDVLNLANDNSKSYSDYSEYWRPAIEEHPQNHSYEDPKFELVTALRISAENCIEKNVNTLEEIVSFLEIKKWDIFQRISLYLIQKYSKETTLLLVDNLLNENFIFSKALNHEYSNLLKFRFVQLNEENRDRFFTLLQTGPKSLENNEEYDDLRMIWRLRRLTVIKEHLFGYWKKYYETLLCDYPEPENPEFLIMSGDVQIGPTSPISIDQLKTKGIPEIIQFLRTWKKPIDFSMDSPEGIARTISEVISENPQNFVENADNFIGLNPSYIRGFFEGINKAIVEDKLFDWEPVINLAVWVIAQTDNNFHNNQINSWDSDPDFRWTRREISGLLEVGLQSKTNKIPFKLSQKIWNLISRLITDFDPTSPDENTTMSPYMLSINTIRGKALHALISYGYWKKKHLASKNHISQSRVNFSSYMPEISQVLDSFLIKQIECPPDVMAVFGWKYPNLMYLDPEWAEINRNMIFPKSNQTIKNWEASWFSFISFNKPSSLSLKVLSEEYQFAINSIIDPQSKSRLTINYHHRLAFHIISYYAWGDIELSSPLMISFLNYSNQEIRIESIRFIGQTNNDVPKKIIHRLKTLFENWLTIFLNPKGGETYIPELQSSGRLLSSDIFDDLWVVEQLEKILVSPIEIEDHLEIIIRLSNLPEELLQRGINILILIIKYDNFGFASSLWEESIKKIISRAKNSRSEILISQFHTLINLLCANGFPKYKSFFERTDSN